MFHLKKCEYSNSDEYYIKLLSNRHYTFEISEVIHLCSDDKTNYQACGLHDEKRLGESEIPCKQLLCFDSLESYAVNRYASTYNGACEIKARPDCEQSSLRLSQKFCQQLTIQEVGKEIFEIQMKTCDMLCQSHLTCEDESICNGYQYGLYCKRKGRIRYIKTSMVCDTIDDCDDSLDEENCSPYADSECYRFLNAKNYQIDLRDHTRCGPLWLNQKGQHTSYCKYFVDQYNCSDPYRGLLRCEKNTFPTTVSSGVLCKNIFPLCDDSIDTECSRLSDSCLVHKHLLCDHTADCLDESDENSTQCHNMDSSKCYRR